MLKNNTFQFLSISLLTFFLCLSCGFASDEKVLINTSSDRVEVEEEIIVGAERMSEYLPMLKGKSIAIVANQSSRVGEVHLLDTLLASEIDVKRIFTPEHGFRGTEDAGASVLNSVDEQSGLPLISLYGKNKKPKKEQLEGIDVILFDLQDVGVRFYTYLSTLHYVMQAASEENIQLIVLDRPNSFMNVVDGPLMKEDQMSFVGLHPVPLVYGMSMGEYAHMINEEGWTKSGKKAELQIIRCENLKRESDYELPIPPSPNLPNMRSIHLYPSLALFEGTVISVGRGTTHPFQQIGHPDLKSTYQYSFTPHPTEGASKPKLNGQVCFGVNLQVGTKLNQRSFELKYLIDLYQAMPNKEGFFNSFFNLLAGDQELRSSIESGMNEEEIRSQWKDDLAEFMKLREKYLIYE